MAEAPKKKHEFSSYKGQSVRARLGRRVGISTAQLAFKSSWDLLGLVLGVDFKILLSEPSCPGVCLGLLWAFPGHSSVSYLASALCFHPCLPPGHNPDTPGQPDLGNASVYLPGLRVGKANY